MNIDPLVKQLWMARIKAGRSMRNVAAQSGVNQGSISECERGYHAPSLATLKAWAAALGFELILREVGPVSTSPETGPLPEGITPEFAASVEEFMDENDEALRRLAAGPPAESTKDGTEGGAA